MVTEAQPPKSTKKAKAAGAAASCPSGSARKEKKGKQKGQPHAPCSLIVRSRCMISHPKYRHACDLYVYVLPDHAAQHEPIPHGESPSPHIYLHTLCCDVCQYSACFTTLWSADHIYPIRLIQSKRIPHNNPNGSLPSTDPPTDSCNLIGHGGGGVLNCLYYLYLHTGHV